MIYIITWIIVSMRSVPCPTEKDEYGRIIKTNTYQLCYATDKQQVTKQYFNRDSAFTFYRRIDSVSKAFSMEEGRLYRGSIKEVKIDSLKIN